MLHLVKRASRFLLLAFAFAVTACSGGEDEAAAPRTEFNVGWSIYAGWMPWPYAEQAGIVKKWGDKYGITIKFVQVNDYIESVNQYTAGKLDGVTVANMDALTIPAAGGKDTSAIILGDYSNGNDAVLLKEADSVAGMKGRQVYLAELSVSHYLLARALEKNALKLTDVKTVNTSDADIAAAFGAPAVTAAVAWNPQVTTMKGVAGAKAVFTSADIPGEILDLMVVDTKVLKANPNLGKALAGIWFETMTLMARQDAEGAAARAVMAKLSGTDAQAFEGQLATTFLYTDAKAAVAAMASPELVTTMTRVRDFSFAQGLFGQGAASADAVGMEFPGGKTLGDKAAITLRFDPTYMQLAADGKL